MSGSSRARAESAKPSRATKESVELDQLLYSRAQVCRMLGGIHVATVIRLEQSGKLPPVKLTPADQGKTFYRRADVFALVEGASE